MKGFILRHGYFIPGNDGIEVLMNQSECRKKKYGKCPIEGIVAQLSRQKFKLFIMNRYM